jgi:hypothetical protein
MVEMAIVLPVFILLIFGMLEFGLAFKDKLAMAHATGRGSRVAAVQGNEAEADHLILKGFESGLAAAVSLDSVLYVDIFKANTDGSPAVWDRYVPDGSACGWSPCPAIVPGPPVYGFPADYKPCDRDTSFDPIDGLDTIGVRVTYTHTWVTGVLGLSSSTWVETTRARMEPKVFGTQDPSC